MLDFQPLLHLHNGFPDKVEGLTVDVSWVNRMAIINAKSKHFDKIPRV
jgi:hypothetical protein